MMTGSFTQAVMLFKDSYCLRSLYVHVETSKSVASFDETREKFAHGLQA
jgi:hypothetical protein